MRNATWKMTQQRYTGSNFRLRAAVKEKQRAVFLGAKYLARHETRTPTTTPLWRARRHRIRAHFEQFSPKMAITARKSMAFGQR